MSHLVWSYDKEFRLEIGATLPGITIAYNTWGTLNKKRDNVIWINHALTANSDAEAWWPGMIGKGLVFDPSTHFIVCANILGSCYGTTGPASVNPITRRNYDRDFPLVTIRDIVHAHQLLAAHLDIHAIEILIGGSLGGHQAMEWAVTDPAFIRDLALIATSPRHSAWGIAFNEAQRMALRAGTGGLEAARAIAMLSYRNYNMYSATQTDKDDKLDNFKASTYQQYQGEKLRARFDAESYYILSKAMDSHNLARGRKSIAQALLSIKAKTLVIGISSDILFPLHEQRTLATNIPGAVFYEIDSPYGHDGFLIEVDQISELIRLHFFDEHQPSEKKKKISAPHA